MLSRIVSFVTGVPITDCSSGFKAFRMSHMARLELREDQFQASEVLIQAAKQGLRIGEVPIHVERRRYGVSRKGHDFWYGLLFSKVVIRSWLR